mgnify:CR=1 FL=1
MLTIKNLVAGYGKVQVLHGISIDVPKGKVVTLIGSNGAQIRIRVNGTIVTNSTRQKQITATLANTQDRRCSRWVILALFAARPAPVKPRSHVL